MSGRLKKLLAAFCAAAIALCPLNIAAFAEDIIEQTVIAPEPVIADEAYSETGYRIAVFDGTEFVPESDTSPLLHSSDQELVYNRMIAMQAEYPEGKSWTNSDKYVWTNRYYGEKMTLPYSTYEGGGCEAFCMILSDAAFGDVPAYEKHNFKYSDLRVGDYLRVDNDRHSVMIMKIDSTGVVLAEGNYNKSIHWGRTLTKAEVMKADYYVTRYDQSEEPTPPPVSDEVEINETNFRDANFRQYVSANFDTDHNTKLSKSEISAVEDISVDSMSISDLKGIEFFTSLRILMCSGNSLTSLDLSKNTALTHLECSYNKLATLDLSKNTALEIVRCGSNDITNLNVTKCSKLKELNCTGNNLSKLDVTKNTVLAELYCGANELTTLDVSKNTALTDLDCSGNKLRALDVTKCTALIYLECDSNRIRTLDLSNNTKLANLGCTSNQLTSLDVSNNPGITSFSASGNRYNIGAVSTYDLSKLPGFDPSKTSSWAGAVFDGVRNITITSTAVTYRYDCGNGYSEMFMLLAEDSPDSVLTVGTGGDYASVAEAVAKINDDIKNKSAQEQYTIKIMNSLEEKSAVTFPDVPVVLKADTDAVLLVPSITAKNDLTVAYLGLTTSKGTGTPVTAKKAFTAVSSLFGAAKVTGRADISSCTINGALTLSSKDMASKLTNSKVTGKISASAGLELTNCSETGAVTAKGEVVITGPTTVNGAITVNGNVGQTYLDAVTVNGKITAGNDLVLSECPAVGAITAKAGLVIDCTDDHTATGAITASAKTGTVLMADTDVCGKLTCSCELVMARCNVTGNLTAKGALSTSECIISGNVSAQCKTEKSYLSQTGIMGNVTAAADLGMTDSAIGGKLTVKGDLYLTSTNTVIGEILTTGICSDNDGNELTFAGLSVTKNGIITGSKKLTLCLIKITDKKTFNFEYVKMETGGKKPNVIVKKFNGAFSSGILLLSDENLPGGSIVLDKGKLIVVS